MKINNLFEKRLVNIAFAVSIVTSLLIVLIVYFIPLVYKQILVLDIFDLCVVVFLVLDYCARLSKTTKKTHFILKNWYEIPAMIPLILLVGTDPSSSLQYVRFVAFFRLIRLYQLLSLLKGSGGELITLAAASGISIIFGGLAVLLAESSEPSSNIRTVGDGVWWAITTVTTVGYGDYYPVTGLGKVIGSFLMFVGLLFLTTFTGILSSTLVLRRFGSKAKDSDSEKKLLDKTKEFVKDKIDQVEKLDENDMNTLIMVIKSLNEKDERSAT
jgi:voltage-gated potassium channel